MASLSFNGHLKIIKIWSFKVVSVAKPCAKVRSLKYLILSLYSSSISRFSKKGGRCWEFWIPTILTVLCFANYEELQSPGLIIYQMIYIILAPLKPIAVVSLTSLDLGSESTKKKLSKEFVIFHFHIRKYRVRNQDLFLLGIIVNG